VAAAALVVAAGAGVPLVRYVRSSMGAEARAPKPAPINGERAFGYLKEICDLGPRPAGSSANERQRKLVVDHFKAKGGKVRLQPFAGRDPSNGKRVEMVNVVASWEPGRADRVLIAAHYDTRPFADMDDEPKRSQFSFLGANDCASGVALLMEIANHLETFDTPWGVDLVLLDGEELVYGRNADLNNYFLGSKHFARTYAADRKSGKAKHRYVAGILLDMVGGRNVAIKQEPYSLTFARGLVQEVWQVAADLEESAFRPEVGVEVSDDHLPLNNIAGIPTIDVIDFEYPFWHTTQDLPENCSPDSLEKVGRVLTGWLSLPKRGTKKK
jgi:hypothetical protein